MRSRGFTVAEVLVASTISLLVLGLVISCWMLVTQGWRKTYRLQTVQESTMVSTTRLREDYRRSKPGSARIDGPTLSFLVYDDGSGESSWDPSGQILWRCWVQYRWQNQVLRRRQVALATPLSEPGQLPPAWTEPAEGHRLGRDLTACDWTLQGGVLLQVRTKSEFEEVPSSAFLRVTPFLYQPD
ncbi:MAG: prepilin-type N-terminal cleavage/methylation domain-containing protein [Candidatus Eremiobacteraeota bacterium]|nr:prepilin-type N-terminal cleavage/methylation domain-containing protein [Candidatus Eremiobacteraeota bacterium]